MIVQLDHLLRIQSHTGALYVGGETGRDAMVVQLDELLGVELVAVVLQLRDGVGGKLHDRAFEPGPLPRNDTWRHPGRERSARRRHDRAVQLPHWR